MPRNSGGRPRHILSTYITVLKKTNVGDKECQCVCKACVEVLKDEVKPIVNRKKRIHKYLANCEHFWTKYGEEAKDILENCDVEETSSAKYIRLDGNFRTDSTSTSFNSSHRSSSGSNIFTGKSQQPLISKYLVRDLNKSEIPIFHDFLIRMTVSNGWAFQWINDSSTQAFFYWLNPKLKLPDRKQLSAGITLSFDSWKNIINQELLGIMIILPSGETLVWKAIDISGQRERTIDVIPHVEEMLMDLEN
ncbi:hypothetical protein C1645_814903 [Glomus cerebriforme]|uniref:Uncharacterized protein n=1 Tax=Glomus cerebriforme TaxID=658196 RepID=A0A397TK30_9GLOM|nr:hypothetical protein C1645_814903 [Glomus cerebriforme]